MPETNDPNAPSSDEARTDHADDSGTAQPVSDDTQQDEDAGGQPTGS